MVVYCLLFYFVLSAVLFSVKYRVHKELVKMGLVNEGGKTVGMGLAEIVVQAFF